MNLRKTLKGMRQGLKRMISPKPGPKPLQRKKRPTKRTGR